MDDRCDRSGNRDVEYFIVLVQSAPSFQQVASACQTPLTAA
jgi:hypothetical protein